MQGFPQELSKTKRLIINNSRICGGILLIPSHFNISVTIISNELPKGSSKELSFERDNSCLCIPFISNSVHTFVLAIRNTDTTLIPSNYNTLLLSFHYLVFFWPWELKMYEYENPFKINERSKIFFQYLNPTISWLIAAITQVLFVVTLWKLG